jgi:hypothetical protein
VLKKLRYASPLHNANEGELSMPVLYMATQLKTGMKKFKDIVSLAKF